MTNFDELKTRWEEHDRLLEKSLRLNHQLLTAARLEPARSALRRLALSAALEAAAWLAIAVALGSFLAGHIRTPGLALSAAVADVMSIGMLAALVRRAVGNLQIDYGQPVSSIQKRVESLRVLRIRTTKWGLLCGTLLWVPWLAVVAQATAGIDIYRSLEPRWLLANALFGLALFPAAVWVSRTYGDRIDASPFFQRLMKVLAGTNLSAAQGFLATIREFERE